MKLKSFLILFVLLLVHSIIFAQDGHDSAIFVVDISNSVKAPDVSKAVSILKDMNSKFPDYVKSAGIMTFGNYKFPMTLKPEWVMKVSDYDKNATSLSLDKITANKGRTPIGEGLVASEEGIKAAIGKTALILVSDGIDNGLKCPISLVEKMKKTFGDKLCVFTIQMRDSNQGAKLLKQLVKAGKCGKATKSSALTTDSEIQDLVDFIFPPRIPEPTPTMTPLPTPRPTPPLDSDRDGVINDYDKCPKTPYGARVDSEGCWRLQNLHFEFDSSKLQPESLPILDHVADVLKANPKINVTIEGHTDSKGSDAYNMKLSQKRAVSVLEYLVSKGISEQRLSSKGYGESDPIFDNKTPEGMAKNRRIELTVTE